MTSLFINVHIFHAFLLLPTEIKVSPGQNNNIWLFVRVVTNVSTTFARINIVGIVQRSRSLRMHYSSSKFVDLPPVPLIYSGYR